MAQVCYQYADNGNCRYGDSCRFSHSNASNGDEGEFQTVGAPRKSSPPATRGGSSGFGGSWSRGNGGSSRGPNPNQQCHSFAETGSCDYGDRCRFAHGADDERVGRSSDSGYTGSRSYGGGFSNSRGGSSRPAQQCYSFAENGTCQYGDRCRFSHGTEKTAATGGRDRSNEACYSFQSNGSCRFGENCRFSHTATDGAAGENANETLSGSDGQPAAPAAKTGDDSMVVEQTKSPVAAPVQSS